jgi:hypothetical protein
MATKNNPGPRDFYAELGPDEEFIIFGAHDVTSPMMGRLWSMIRLQQINAGIYPDSDRQQVKDMMDTVTRMEIQAREMFNRQQIAGMEFDDRGIPLTGAHARKARNSTSGANDT